jgi:diacylglycerol O-acyltransferase / wax synthase
MDRLTPQNSSFIHADAGTQYMHVCSVAVFDGPGPTYDELRVLLEGVLPLVPQYRQRVKQVPFNAGRPVWVDDPRFDLRFHLRHTGLPSPGSDEQLQLLVGRVAATRLDPRRPLWEMWLTENLSGGRWALILKTHQAMTDGVGTTPLVTVLLSPTRSHRPAVTDLWDPGPEPNDVALWMSAMTDLAVEPAELGRLLRAGMRVQWAFMNWIGGQVRQRCSQEEEPRWGSPSLHGPISKNRRWSFVDLALDDVRTVRDRWRVTTNDVIVAAVCSGFRTLLRHRGEMLDDTPLSVLFPVSVRDRDDGEGRYENDVSVIGADLPVTVADPVERLRMIAADLAAKTDESVAGDVLASLSGYAPPVLLALGTRAATRLARYQTEFQSVITNVPGPQESRYLLGRRLVGFYPVVPLLEGVHITVGAVSYDGGVWVGVTGDYDSCPDLDLMTAGVRTGLAELVESSLAVAGATG